MKKLSYTKPKVYPENQSMKTPWFVAFRCNDHSTGATKQFQYRDKINSFSTKAERVSAGKALVSTLTCMLEAGWNPFTKEAETPQQQEVKTIKQVIDDCVAMKCATLKKFSHKVYKHVSKYFLIWLEKKCISYLFPGSFTRTMAIEYMDLLAMKGYNQKTYNNHLLTLRTIFNWMIERDIITSNPFSKLPKMKEKQSEHSSFTAPERDRLKTALIDNNKRLYYACQFVYYCMLRRPELASIRVGDIDFENMTIKISGSNAKSGRSEMLC